MLSRYCRFIDNYTSRVCPCFICSLPVFLSHSLKDALKEQVKEVGRESQIKLRHFIDNKELASVTADLYLPLIVLQDTIGLV